MIQSIARTMTRPFPYDDRKAEAGKEQRSLNRDARRREMFRITMENHKLLDRLENLRPYYSTKRLLDDHAKQQKYVVNSSWTARRARLYDRGLEEDEDLEEEMPGMPQSASAPDLQLPP